MDSTINSGKRGQWSESIYRENNLLYKDYQGYRAAWFKDAVKYNNFRRGFHFSKDEESDLLRNRQAPIPINVTTAICETAEALLTAGDPIISVTPARFTNDNNRQAALAVAEKYKFALTSTWYNSLGSLQYDRIIQDYNNVGRGLAYIIPKFIGKEFSVDIKYLSFRDFYPDPNSRDPHYSDSDNMIISYVLSVKSAFRLARMYDPGLEFESFKKEFAQANNLDTVDPYNGDKYIRRGGTQKKGEERARLITRYSLEEQEFYYAVPITENMDPQILQQSTELYYKYQDQKFFEVPDDVIQLVNQGLLNLERSKGFYLTEYTSIGGYGLRKVYPVDLYNIVPFVYDHNDHPYPLGRVHYIYPLQRALNKCLMIAILNASLSNNLKWLYEDKSIVDIDNWRNNLAIPGAMLSWRRLTPETTPPMPIQPVPLSEMFLQFPRYLQYTMEYVSGISSVLMGVSDDKVPDVFKTVAAMQSAGGERVKRRVRNIDSSLTVVGRTIASFYREFAPYNGTLSWVEGLNKVKEVGYNQLQPNPNDPTKLGVVPETDLSIGFGDLRFITTANQGYENANMAQILTQIATQNSLPEMVPLILKKLNIPEVEEIIEAMDFKKQANQTIEQQKQQIDQLNKVSEQQASQIAEASKQITTEQFKGKLVRTLESLKVKFKDDLNTRKELDSLLDSFNPDQVTNNLQGKING